MYKKAIVLLYYCILFSENLNELDNGPVHQKVNFEH